MAEKDAGEGAENELIIADIPEDQSPLVCVEYPGPYLVWLATPLLTSPYCTGVLEDS